MTQWVVQEKIILRIQKLKFQPLFHEQQITHINTNPINNSPIILTDGDHKKSFAFVSDRTPSLYNHQPNKKYRFSCPICRHYTYASDRGKLEDGSWKELEQIIRPKVDLRILNQIPLQTARQNSFEVSVLSVWMAW